MNVPQIRIQSTSALLGIRTTPSQLEIEQPPVELIIEQPPAEMNISKTPARLTIDQTKAREDIGFKSLLRATEDAAQQGRQDILEGMSRRAQEGDELMMIENGGAPIAAQAKRNSEGPELEFNIGWIPSPGSVKINYDPGNIKISWKTNKPVIQANINKPMINYSPGNVDIFLERYPSLKIDFTK